MKWRQPADRAVVNAVVAVFRAQNAAAAFSALAPLSLPQWQRSLHWLDVSGTALYLLDRLQTLGITHVLPDTILNRLRGNLLDSHDRVNSMFAEFLELNRLFLVAGITFCNLKGFTLSPHSCPRPELRYQLDFDFLVDHRDLDRSRAILIERGYELRGQGPEVLEFKSRQAEIPTLASLYQAKHHFSAEVHFSTQHDPRLDRLQTLTFRGQSFLALSPADQFINQATHLFGHLGGASTRVSWVLEFASHMQHRARDISFWREVASIAAANRHAAIALSAVTELAEQLLAVGAPSALNSWLAAYRDDAVTRWVRVYGLRALLADAPGTKLGLILKDQLPQTLTNNKRRALLPLHRAPRLVATSRGQSLRTRAQNELLQLRFELFRLRFHLVEGARYLIESFRWRRRLRHADTPPRFPPPTGRVVAE